jgi:hypothetical protein
VATDATTVHIIQNMRKATPRHTQPEIVKVQERIKQIRPFRHYTGIGSRNTPEAVGEVLTRIAKNLCRFEHVLRSGGADGSDTYFENGVEEFKEIYIPWKGFNDSKSLLYPENMSYDFDARTIAHNHHPAWNSLTEPVKKLHTRNVYQVLGYDLESPSDFVICYAPQIGDNVQGGTGQAVRIAKTFNIPVYNMFLEKHRKEVFAMLSRLNVQHAYRTIKRLYLFAWQENKVVETTTKLILGVPLEDMTEAQKKVMIDFSNKYWSLLESSLRFEK